MNNVLFIWVNQRGGVVDARSEKGQSTKGMYVT